jgi:hypothetical protein
VEGKRPYVVSPAVASIIADTPTGPSAYFTLDEFILCSIRMDSGLEPGSPPELPIMYVSGCIESWRDAVKGGYFIGDWYAAEPEGIWSKGYGILQFRLTPEQHSRYHAVSLQLVVPVGANGVQYRIQSGRHVAAGTFPGSTVPRVEMFELQLFLQDAPDNIQRLVLITQDPVRPVDIGLNNDTRMFGLGVRGVTLIP